jgi:hypothetical protein
MVRRAGLRKMAAAAFEKTCLLYQEGLINSEAGLSAAMWHELRVQFKANELETFKIVVQPRLEFSEGIKVDPSIRYPDLVVCNRDEAIGVIELKFAPRGRPSSVKDLSTFERLAAIAPDNPLEVRRDRWHGPAPLKVFPLADDAVFIWGAIGKVPTTGTQPPAGAEARYLRLFYSSVERKLI